MPSEELPLFSTSDYPMSLDLNGENHMETSYEKYFICEKYILNS